MIELLVEHGTKIGAVLVFAADVLASAHAVLHKRDSRSALGWVGIIWLVPVVGAVLYVGFGINRIHRRAHALRAASPIPPGPAAAVADRAVLPVRLPPAAAHLATLTRVVAEVTRRPLLGGNRVRLLVDGDEAYPAMLEAIRGATASVSMASYLFNLDRAGSRFVEALGAAAARGVEVRVLLDAVGMRYSRASTARALERSGVRTGVFLPTRVPWRLPFLNLRNHRKILVVDGTVAFTGGLNVQEGCLRRENPRRPVQDVHFRLEGPIVEQVQETFVADWAFAQGEILAGEAWFPGLRPDGPVLARSITDGPDDDFERLRWVLVGALGAARRSVRVVTPYFLPETALVAALGLAALRGVEVEIFLPQRGNLRVVQWASTAMLWQVLERGCRVFLTPPPFDHSKLVLVDDAWALFGSSNWDPRSLRLNFELDVECYDPSLAATLAQEIRWRRETAREITLADVDGRSLPVRLRDGAARLLQPYL
jgi:cardiolipin synthase